MLVGRSQSPSYSNIHAQVVAPTTKLQSEINRVPALTKALVPTKAPFRPCQPIMCPVNSIPNIKNDGRKPMNVSANQIYLGGRGPCRGIRLNPETHALNHSIKTRMFFTKCLIHYSIIESGYQRFPLLHNARNAPLLVFVDDHSSVTFFFYA
jgi:hypothetical protein